VSKSRLGRIPNAESVGTFVGYLQARCHSLRATNNTKHWRCKSYKATVSEAISFVEMKIQKNVLFAVSKMLFLWFYLPPEALTYIRGKPLQWLTYIRGKPLQWLTYIRGKPLQWQCTGNLTLVTGGQGNTGIVGPKFTVYTRVATIQLRMWQKQTKYVQCATLWKPHNYNSSKNVFYL